MSERPASFGGFEAQSLFCPQCNQAQPVREKLLLVLPGGDKYAYFCRVCGAELGSKLDSDPNRPPFGLGG
jgi:hypothetical protein